MALNMFKVTQLVSKIAAIQLYNELSIAKKFKRQFVNDMKAKVGTTVNAKKPVRYIAQDGPSLVLQGIQEDTIPVKITKDRHVGLELDIFDATFNTEADITKYADEFVIPAVRTLADDVDNFCAQQSINLYNYAGTAGTTPGTDDAHGYLELANVGQIMMENAVPMKQRKNLVLDAKGLYTLPNSLKSLFVREAQEAVTTGRIGRAVDFDIYGSNNVPYHTSGTLAGSGATSLVNGANQQGSTLNIDGCQAGDNLTAGDIVTIAGVYAVNVVNKNILPSRRLQQFVATAAVAQNGGAMTISLSPEIIGPNADGSINAYQNVSAIPADNAIVTLAAASHTRNFAFTEDTFTLVTVPLKVPKSAKIAAAYEYEGIYVLLTSDYDIVNRREITRLDMVYGARELWPETGCVLAG